MPFPFFNQQPANVRRFRKALRNANRAMRKTEPLKTKYDQANRIVVRAERAIISFSQANPNLQVVRDSVENTVFEKKLVRRKLFTVGVDALIAIPALQLTMQETLGVPLTTPIALLVGCGASYCLLYLAIDFRVDDNAYEKTGFERIWAQYSFIIPLLLFPILSLYEIAVASGGGAASLVWLVFIAFSFLLNVKTASFARQYRQADVSKLAKEIAKRREKKLAKGQKARDEVSTKMTAMRSTIDAAAMELKDAYLALPAALSARRFNMSPKYVLALNNHVFFQQILPFEPPMILNIEGEVNEYNEFYGDVMRAPSKNEVDAGALHGATPNQPGGVAAPPPPTRPQQEQPTPNPEPNTRPVPDASNDDTTDTADFEMQTTEEDTFV